MLTEPPNKPENRRNHGESGVVSPERRQRPRGAGNVKCRKTRRATDARGAPLRSDRG
jgi:hypothetical protein